jgi:hypothetical protein
LFRKGEEASVLRPRLAELKLAAAGDLRFKVGRHIFGDPFALREALAWMELCPGHELEVNCFLDGSTVRG